MPSWAVYGAKIHEMGAIVEEFIERALKRSPSVQYRIDPLGQIEVISTHRSGARRAIQSGVSRVLVSCGRFLPA